MMKQLRKILFPFSIVYDIVTSVRNFLYEKNILKSHTFDIPVICIGNLSTGGTGKTPMTEYLISLLQNQYSIAVLSRGYGRKTRGFHQVATTDSPENTGDEPLQIKKKFPHITVAVDENRVHGISILKENHNLILLDDAFQHRRVKPSFTILLTGYDQLFVNDLLLPAGNLRESRRGAKRADVIIVTKCPKGLSEQEKDNIRKKIKPLPEQPLLFSHLEYANNCTNTLENKPLAFFKDQKFTLITGIANPAPLVNFLKSSGLDFEHLKFPDHHAFSEKEMAIFKQKDLILTTEKDFVRLDRKLSSEKLFYLPVKMVLEGDLTPHFPEFK